MLRAIISSTLCLTLSLSPCVGQQQEVPLNLRVPDEYTATQRDILLKDLEARARAGDGWSAYLMGNAADQAIIKSEGLNNTTFAVQWYRFAVDHGSWAAEYKLAYWMKTKRIWMTDPQGKVSSWTPEECERMMKASVDAGYNPATDKMRPPVQTQARTQAALAKSSADDSSAGLWALLGIGLVAAIAASSSSSSTKSETKSNSTDSTPMVCMVRKPFLVDTGSSYVPYRTEYRMVPGYGSECN